jgi:hypothetical protein
MARRKTSSASYAAPGRGALTSRRFNDSIDQLTAESIEQSLREIEKALQLRYGGGKKKREPTPQREARVEG